MLNEQITLQNWTSRWNLWNTWIQRSNIADDVMLTSALSSLQIGFLSCVRKSPFICVMGRYWLLRVCGMCGRLFIVWRHFCSARRFLTIRLKILVALIVDFQICPNMFHVLWNKILNCYYLRSSPRLGNRWNCNDSAHNCPRRQCRQIQ